MGNSKTAGDDGIRDYYRKKVKELEQLHDDEQVEATPSTKVMEIGVGGEQFEITLDQAWSEQRKTIQIYQKIYDEMYRRIENALREELEKKYNEGFDTTD